MSWTLTDQPQDFLDAAAHLLDPVRDTVALTLAENARTTDTATQFGWWTAAGVVTGAAVHGAGYPTLICHGGDDALAALLDVVDTDAVSGRSDLAAQLAHLLSARAGRPVVLRVAERLFRLGELVVPAVAGSARRTTERDIPLAAAWTGAFLADAAIAPASGEGLARQRAEHGGLWLWEHNGEPVAMVGHNRVAKGAARIGPVYTPPEHRRNGYAAGLTAAVSRDLLARGVEHVVLFTDLANPTSNGVYARLGFVPVEDRAVFGLAQQ